MQSIGITRDNGEDLGFVITSLFCSAISLDELHEWCYGVISLLDPKELPPYIVDLSEFNGTLASIYKLIGFVPDWDGTDEDEDALCGIAMERGVARDEWPVSREAALAALRHNTKIVERFRSTFPFIKY